MGVDVSLLISAIRAVTLVLAVVCAGAALLGQGGRWSERLDLLNHFEPLWLTGAIAAGALWIATGREGWITAALAAAAALASAGQMAPELLARRGPERSAPGASFKLIQFNLWVFNLDPEGAARWILAQDADVLVLEEASGEQGAVVQQLRDGYPFATTCVEGRACSTVLLSRRRPMAEAALQLELRCAAAWASYPAPGGEVTVVGVHAAWPYPPRLQRRQSQRLAELLQGLPREKLIVAGDFNSTPWSFALRRQDQLFGIERRTRALFSWPAAAWWPGVRMKPPFPILPIDHVYAGPGWRAVKVERGPRLGSDHYPLVVTLSA